MEIWGSDSVMGLSPMMIKSDDIFFFSLIPYIQS